MEESFLRWSSSEDKVGIPKHKSNVPPENAKGAYSHVIIRLVF